MTRKFAVPLTAESAEEAVRKLATLTVIAAGVPDIMAAITRNRLSEFWFWDALIVETALRSGADRLLTEGMRIENPF